jgi:phosphohistidine phosphatase
MLRLLLLRHAKSSWANPGQSDFDRPLNARGRDSAPLIGRYIAEAGFAPQRILCSSAQRARETVALILPGISADMDVTFSRKLYVADGEGYLLAAREAGGTALTLMIVGHNPAMEDVALVLAPIGDADALARMRGKFPTGGLAVIEFEAPHWTDIGPGAGRLTGFHTPKSISGED